MYPAFHARVHARRLYSDRVQIESHRDFQSGGCGDRSSLEKCLDFPGNKKTHLGESSPHDYCTLSFSWNNLD